ncbi:MAG: glycosyltransferase family protein, partial [Candidatus Helarchaeota archaeon]
MKNIAYYITTHGYGHATRSVAIIRALQKIPNLNITVCSAFQNEIVGKWFQSKNINFHKVETLFGVRYKDFIQVDLDLSVNIFKKALQKRKKFIDNELDFCKKNKIDLIISDISPFQFDIAYKLKIPSIAISNFDWYSIFEFIFKKYDLNNFRESLELVKASYEKADVLLRLPFSIDMKYFKKTIDVSLVVRKLTRSREEIRKLLKIRENDFLIFFGITDFNFSAKELIDKFNKLKSKENSLYILFSSFLRPSISNEEYFRFISDSEQESQDYLVSSDIVIGKLGYGTVSECVAYKKPLIYTMRQDFIEDKALYKGIELFGRGK